MRKITVNLVSASKAEVVFSPPLDAEELSFAPSIVDKLIDALRTEFSETAEGEKVEIVAGVINYELPTN